MKLPSELSVTVPLVGPLTRIAVNGSPSTSESLPNTPGAATVRAMSSSVAYASGAATGASFTGRTVSVTVTTFESAAPSFAL